MQLSFVQEMFCHIAEQQPDALAVVGPGERMTYSELSRRSLEIADVLHSAGAGRNEPVAIFAASRSFFIQCTIGTLRCGAAFMPLVPELPVRRLESMLIQCAPRFALVEPQLVDQFRLASRQLPLQIFFGSMLREGNPPLGRSAFVGKPPEGDDLSYIFFTSGSTGKQKAIAGRLKAIDHFVRWEIATFAIGPGSRVSQLISPMFDAFLRDIFVPLCSGGTIYIPEDEEIALGGRMLGDWIQDKQITLIHTVPSIFRLLIHESDGRGQWPSVQHVLLAGEPLLPSDVKRWYQLVGANGGHLINLYGPSETTMTKFVYRVPPEDQFKKTIPIGKPMPGTKAVVVDDGSKVCPPGMVGEILIRTPYRSLGYYRQPALSSEVFIPNPFTNDPDDIVYRTGDLARVLGDGNFELVGRKDHQIKLRGVRIELEEIEAALSEHQKVQQVVMALREDDVGEKHLVAYIVMKAGEHRIEERALRSFLKERLPDPMVPAMFVFLEELPLLPNGKVDRKQLPQPLVGKTQGEARPLNEIEQVLAGIYAALLKREHVEPDASFFEMGGHSLLAAQLASRIRSLFRIELPLRILFERATVAEMARYVRMARDGAAAADSSSIPRVDRSGPLPLSNAQQRLWVIDQLQPGTAAYNLTFGAHANGPLNMAVLEKSINEIVRRHEILRTSFPVCDGTAISKVAPALNITAGEVDLRGMRQRDRDAEVNKQIRLLAGTPFDLASGPLVRVRVFRLQDSEYVLCFSAHHIICDAWSVSIFMRELSVLYKAFLDRKASPLPALPVQYVDVASYERSRLQDEMLDRERRFWKTQLDGCTDILELPVDFARPSVQSHHGARQSACWGPELSAAVAALGQDHGATEFMTLLSLINIWLFSYTGQSDILVGAPVSNRNYLETEALIGLFVNTLVFRTQINRGSHFVDLLNQVRDYALQAYAHPAMPFEMLVDELRVVRDPSRNPLFQVMLNVQNVPVENLKIADVELTDWHAELVQSRFDLHIGAVRNLSGLELIVTYNADLFTSVRIASMLDDLRELASLVTGVPHARIGSLVSELKILQQRKQLQHNRDRADQQIRQLHAARRRMALASTKE